MTQLEYDQLRQTFPFPWSQRQVRHPRQGVLVQVIASNGVEVPIFEMTKFLTFITTRLTQATAAATTPGATP